MVEDDPGILELSLYALGSSGFEVKGFENGAAFFAQCKERLPSLILLDIMLPDQDGLQILSALRSRKTTERIPVIMVSAKGSELDRVKGLDGGADDYVVKPFSVMELVSRVKSLLRRAEADKTDGQLLVHGRVTLDPNRRLAEVDGQDCVLTYKEYELLKLMLVNEGMVLTRDRILNEVWQYDYEGETRTVDAHIKTLRKKLGEAGEAIKTVRNVGYKIGR